MGDSGAEAGDGEGGGRGEVAQVNIIIIISITISNVVEEREGGWVFEDVLDAEEGLDLGRGQVLSRGGGYLDDK